MATSVSSKIMRRPPSTALAAGRIIRQESDQALALLYIRLKSQDVHSTLCQSEEALPQGARFVFNRHCKLLGLRHQT